jgi:hypothetical protein
MVTEPTPPPPSAAATTAARVADAAQVVMPERVRLREDEFHVFHVSVDGHETADVRPVRAFPISAKADYIGFMDKQGHEVALVAHPSKLDKDSRKALDRALGRMYYVPKILSIQSIAETSGVSHWQVRTDRGYATFEVIDREFIRKLGGGRLLIVDVDGNRFEIEKASKLDAKSRALLHSEI